MMRKEQIVEGAILWIDYPYEDIPGKSKRRPVLIIEVEKAKCLCVALKVTSREKTYVGAYKLKNWASCGLTKESYIQIDKSHDYTFAEISSGTFIGIIDPDDYWDLLHEINRYFSEQSNLA